jgi:uncharacterized membrane protein
MPSPLELPRHPVVRGHPVHAILSDLPAALIPAAALAELARRLRPRRESRYLSDAATGAALAGAAAAGIAGWVDWLTMPTEHPAQGPATLHGLINTAGLLCLGAATVLPRRRLELLGVAVTAAAIGGWIGGDLVFRHGWRVRPAEEAEIVEQKLAEAGKDAYFKDARREVAEFERNRTFLGS